MINSRSHKIKGLTKLLTKEKHRGSYLPLSDCRQLGSNEPVVYFSVYTSGIIILSDLEVFFYDGTKKQ